MFMMFGVLRSLRVLLGEHRKWGQRSLRSHVGPAGTRCGLLMQPRHLMSSNDKGPAHPPEATRCRLHLATDLLLLLYYLESASTPFAGATQPDMLLLLQALQLSCWSVVLSSSQLDEKSSDAA